MFLRELYEAKARRVVAVMPGGFHPFHPGHKSLYDWAVKTFGKANVYVAATNDQETRPFPFEVKKKLAAMAGVPESNFMQVKSPFNNREYAHLLDDDTALVFVRSEKDKGEEPLPDRMKIDRKTKKPTNEPRYLRSYTGKDLNTHDEMGYMAYGPTINFDFSGMKIKSASELRASWPKMSDEDKLKAAKLMYGNGAPVAVKLLDQALGVKDEQPVEERSTDQSIKTAISKLFNKKNYKAALAYMKKTGRSAADVARMFDNVDARELDRMATEGTNEMAAYKGNVGIMELVKFYQDAKKNGDEDLIVKVKKLIDDGEDQKVWQIVQDYTGTKLVGKQFAYESIAEMIAVETSLLETESCKHGRYWCSTDKKYKCRQGPKKSRGS